MRMEMNVQSALHLSDFIERRRETRERISRRVTVTNLAQLKLPYPGRIADTSFSGLKLCLGKPVDTAASLSIEWEDTCVLGDVAYCIEDNAGFLVGVKTNYIILDRTRSNRTRNLDFTRISS